MCNFTDVVMNVFIITVVVFLLVFLIVIVRNEFKD